MTVDLDGQPSRFGDHAAQRSHQTRQRPVDVKRLRCPGQFTGSFYETAVYYCYNKLAGIFCFTSFDGGASFEAGGQIVGLATTNGGLHGAISTAPDGTVYVTPRVATPTVIVSKDNGFSWFERYMGEDVGTPNPRKNSEVSTDSASNAYHVDGSGRGHLHVPFHGLRGNMGAREHSHLAR